MNDQSHRIRILVLGWALTPFTATLAGPGSVSVPPDARRGAGLTESDAGTIGLGTDYKATFDGRGFALTPALGARTERNVTLRYELESIHRGSATIHASSDKRARRSRGIDSLLERHALRDGIEEHLTVREGGVEVSYVFPTLPAGTGDLVVRGRIVSSLPAERVGRCDDGLRFVNSAAEGVRIGGVTGIDARGRTVAGRLSYDGSILEMSLPAAFVDTARYPLTLDPIVGPLTSLEISPPDESDPQLAFDAASDTYLLVWERRFSDGDSDIRGRRLDTQGQSAGSLLGIDSSNATDERDPSVGNVRAAAKWLVAYEQGDDIVCRDVALDGSISAKVTIANTSGLEIDPEVGGDSTNVVDNGIIIWHEISASSSRILGVVVDLDAGVSNPPVVVSQTVTLDSDERHFGHAISRTGGIDNRYLITWIKEIPPFNVAPFESDVDAVVVDNFLTPLGNEVALTTNDRRESFVFCDGDGENFMVTYAATTDRDVAVIPVTFHPGLQQTFAGTERMIEENVNDDELPTSIAWLGDSFLVGYLDETGINSFNGFVESIDLLTGKSCEGLFSTTFVDSTSTVAIGSQKHGDPLGAEGAVIVDVVDDANSDGDLFSQAFDPQDGRTFEIGLGCGSGGKAIATSPIVGNSNHAIHLKSALPFRPSFLILSPQQTFVDCTAACRLRADPLNGFVISSTTDTSGSASVGLPLPNISSLAGVEFFAQWIVSTPVPACDLFGGDLSNAVRITIES